MKALNRRVFFDAIRTPMFSGALTQAQVDGINRILDYREAHYPSLRDDAFSYVLATVTWETGHAMRPVREGGSTAYLRGKRYWPWYGRGLVQCTWRENYARYGCADNPEPADTMLDWGKSLVACFDGMSRGIYTGRKLDDFFASGRRDFVGARSIINGRDRAATVAALGEAYLQALTRGVATLPNTIHAAPVATAPSSPVELPAPPTPTTERPRPPDAPAAARPLTPPAAPTPPVPGLWGRVGAMVQHAFFSRKV